MKTCEKCLRPINDDAIFCNHCNSAVYYKPIDIVLNRLRNVVLLILAIAGIVWLSSCKKEDNLSCNITNVPQPSAGVVKTKLSAKSLIAVFYYYPVKDGVYMVDRYICYEPNNSMWKREVFFTDIDGNNVK